MIPGIVYSWSRTIPLDELEMYQFFCYPITWVEGFFQYDPSWLGWKKLNHHRGLIQHNPTHLDWVGPMDWTFFFFFSIFN